MNMLNIKSYLQVIVGSNILLDNFYVTKTLKLNTTVSTTIFSFSVRFQKKKKEKIKSLW